MPFIYKDGRFHFLFLNREDDYLSESLRILNWKQWVWIQASRAGYSRILFVDSFAENQVLLDGFYKADPDSGGADRPLAKDILGALLKKPDNVFRSILAGLDSKGTAVLSHEDFRGLVNHMIAREEESRAAFVIPIKAFADLYSTESSVGQLQEAASHGGTDVPTGSKGCVFIISASLYAEDSLPFLSDKSGVFASALFPEMRSYVWSGTKPGSFYQRMQDAFSGKRMLCKDPLDRQSLYLLLLRRCCAYPDIRLDIQLLQKEADSLYAMLHDRRWAQALMALKEGSPCRDIPIPKTGDEHPLHALLVTAERMDLLKLLKWSVQVFEERQPKLVFDDASDRMPKLRTGSVTEYEVLKKTAAAYETLLSPTDAQRLHERLDRVDRYLYVPWEYVQDASKGDEHKSSVVVPPEIRDAFTKGTQWLESFREYRITSYDSIFRFLERMIVRKPNEYRGYHFHEDYEEIQGMYAQLIGLELSVADARHRLEQLEKSSLAIEEEIRMTVHRLDELGEMDLQVITHKAFLTQNEKEFLNLSHSLSLKNAKLEQAKNLQETVRSQYDTWAGARDEVMLLLDASGRGTEGFQARKADELIRELKGKMTSFRKDEAALEKSEW